MRAAAWRPELPAAPPLLNRRMELEEQARVHNEAKHLLGQEIAELERRVQQLGEENEGYKEAMQKISSITATLTSTPDVTVNY